jgi:CBS domain-containing protein
MSVQDYCRRDACTATPEESIREAAKRMDARRVGCLVVVDDQQRPIGILTDRDIVMRVLRRRGDPDRIEVGAVMQRDPSLVQEDKPLDTAVRVMRRDTVRRIPVVDDAGRLVGILTSDDALQLLANELAGVAEAVRAQFPAHTDPGRALAAHGE